MYNRGWIRIVEASISIIIVLSALFLLYQQTNPAQTGSLNSYGRQILEEAAHDESLRLAIVTNESTSQQQLDSFIRSRLVSRSLTFEARICELDDACGKSNYTAGEIYAVERVFAAAVSSDRPMLTPKKVRLFIWAVRDNTN